LDTVEEEDQMTREQILVAGALLWTVFAVDAISHIATGDWIAPAAAVIVGLTWVALRLPRWARARNSQTQV
jgi:hypothetical protein